MTLEPTQIKTVALGLLGGVIGGCLGYFVFFWMTKQGLYALALPGALLGLGAGQFAQQRSLALAIVCGVAGLALGLFTEWQFAPFIADSSFVFFITHVHKLKTMTWLMLAVGTFCGFSLALRGKPKRSVAA